MSLAFPVGEYDRAQNFVAQETHVFSPTIIGVARFSYLRNKFLLDQHLNHESPSDLGFQYDPTLASAAGPPFIQVGGYASVGDPITGPRNTFQNTFDFSGSLSWIHGRHELKFGGGYPARPDQCLAGHRHQWLFCLRDFPLQRWICQLSVRQSGGLSCKAEAILVAKSVTGLSMLTARIPTRSHRT